MKHASEHQGQSVFTDGSKSSEGVGCAVVTGDTVIRRKLPSSCSIFTAEAFAILLAVKHVFNKGNFKETFTIFTDSAKQVGLEINQQKTKIMKVTRHDKILGNIRCGNMELEAVDSF